MTTQTHRGWRDLAGSSAMGSESPIRLTAAISGGGSRTEPPQASLPVPLPTPTSWNYNPNQQIAGVFINLKVEVTMPFDYTSTSGVGLSALNWQINRPFVFFENSLSYKRYVSILRFAASGQPARESCSTAPGPELSRNFFTLRWQAHTRIELDFNHTYFRDISTFDPSLIGTGLLDQFLFQGFSAGARVEALKQVFVYADLGRSNRTGDAKNSLNQLYGLTFNRLPWMGLRAICTIHASTVRLLMALTVHSHSQKT